MTSSIGVCPTCALLGHHWLVLKMMSGRGHPRPLLRLLGCASVQVFIRVPFISRVAAHGHRSLANAGAPKTVVFGRPSYLAKDQ